MKAKVLSAVSAAVLAAASLPSCSASELIPESPEEKLSSALQTAVPEHTLPAETSAPLAAPAELYGFVPDEPAAARYFLEGCSADEQEIYSRLYSGIFNLDGKIAVPSGVLAHDAFGELLSMTVMTSPWSDAMDSRYSVSIAADDTVESLTADYILTPEEAMRQYSELTARAAEIAAEVSALSTDYEKICYIHDSIILNCGYSPSAPDSHSAYGALISGKAVCEGYAKAFDLLCELSGITAVPVSGTASSPENGSQPHMWNKVLLDGEWYNVDVTWDDPTGSDDPLNIRYDYLLVSDEYISVSHAEDPNLYMPEPAAGNSFGSWYYREGRVIGADTDETYAAKAFLDDWFCYGSGERTLRVYCESDEVYERVCGEWFGDGSGSFRSMLTDYASPGESISYSFSDDPRTRVITITIN